MATRDCIASRPPHPGDDDCMELLVVLDGKSHRILWGRDVPVAYLKAFCASQMGLAMSPDALRLRFVVGGGRIEDWDTPRSLAMNDRDIIELYVDGQEQMSHFSGDCRGPPAVLMPPLSPLATASPMKQKKVAAIVDPSAMQGPRADAGISKDDALPSTAGALDGGFSPRVSQTDSTESESAPEPEESAELKRLKMEIRGILSSHQDPLDAAQINGDYRELNNKFIPYIRLGFADLDAFLATLPDVVRAIPAKDGKRIFYKVVSAPKMKHITRFVKRQIASKHKRQEIFELQGKIHVVDLASETRDSSQSRFLPIRSRSTIGDIRDPRRVSVSSLRSSDYWRKGLAAGGLAAVAGGGGRGRSSLTRVPFNCSVPSSGAGYASTDERPASAASQGVSRLETSRFVPMRRAGSSAGSSAAGETRCESPTVTLPRTATTTAPDAVLSKKEWTERVMALIAEMSTEASFVAGPFRGRATIPYRELSRHYALRYGGDRIEAPFDSCSHRGIESSMSADADEIRQRMIDVLQAPPISDLVDVVIQGKTGNHDFTLVKKDHTGVEKANAVGVTVAASDRNPPVVNSGGNGSRNENKDWTPSPALLEAICKGKSHRLSLDCGDRRRHAAPSPLLPEPPGGERGKIGVVANGSQREVRQYDVRPDTASKSLSPEAPASNGANIVAGLEGGLPVATKANRDDNLGLTAIPSQVPQCSSSSDKTATSDCIVQTIVSASKHGDAAASGGSDNAFRQSKWCQYWSEFLPDDRLDEFEMFREEIAKNAVEGAESVRMEVASLERKIRLMRDHSTTASDDSKMKQCKHYVLALRQLLINYD